MANNKTGKDAAGATFTYKTTDNAGVDTPSVNVDTVPADPFGANADAVVAAGAAGSIQAKLRRLTTDIGAIATSVAAATPAGTNNIGDVDVLTVPADPFGANADALVSAGATGSIQAKLRRISLDIDAMKTAITVISDAVSGTEMQVDIVSGSSSGIQYTEADTDASITGTAMLWEDTSDTLRAVSAAKPLPVNVTTGSITLTGEDHIGQVGGTTVVIRPTITVDTAIYAALDVLGAAATPGTITLTNAMRISGGTGKLQSLCVYDDDNEKANITFLFFNSAPASGTYTGNGALALSSGDKALFLGRVDVASADYLTVGGDAVASLKNIGLEMQAVGTANIYTIPVVTSGTPTFTSSGDLKLAFGFEQD